jgi:precorrin-6A/cobalt-precorrin-6A reductase
MPHPLPAQRHLCLGTGGDTLAAALGAALGACDAVLDASHGFDSALTAAAHAGAVARNLPFLRLSRPVWPVTDLPGWHHVPDVAAARGLIAPEARVFAATGWASLPALQPFPGAKLLLRQTRPHQRPAPFEKVELVFGAPPFTRSSETALFKDLSVDTLICRNIGGAGSRPKLDAAADLGLTVILIDRPQRPDGIEEVCSAEAALDWVARQ